MTRYGTQDFQALTDRIGRELADAARWLSSTRSGTSAVTSIFFGGGTPSLLPVPLLAEIFNQIGRHFAVRSDAEITLEANPETVSETFARDLRAHCPVNRVSLGAQSFQAKYLTKLERLGSRESIQRAVERLRGAGFSNLSLDLIFAIPGQSTEEMEADIDAAAALLPQHISAYNLTLKPGHPLFSHLPDDDQCADLYELGIRLLQDRGYAQYEISNYARAGFPSLHNLLYWSGGDYLGVGPSAASRFLWEGRFHHRKQLSDLRQYLGQAEFPGPVFEPTTWGQTVLEATFLELRTNQGVKLDTFASRYGYDLRSARRYAYYRDLDLLQESDGWLKLSPKGTLLADTITSDLVDVEPTAEAAVV